MPNKISKHWNIQEIITLFFSKYAQSHSEKIIWGFRVIGKQGPFIAVTIIWNEILLLNLNLNYLTKFLLLFQTYDTRIYPIIKFRISLSTAI